MGLIGGIDTKRKGVKRTKAIGRGKNGKVTTMALAKAVRSLQRETKAELKWQIVGVNIPLTAFGTTAVYSTGCGLNAITYGTNPFTRIGQDIRVEQFECRFEIDYDADPSTAQEASNVRVVVFKYKPGDLQTTPGQGPLITDIINPTIGDTPTAPIIPNLDGVIDVLIDETFLIGPPATTAFSGAAATANYNLPSSVFAHKVSNRKFNVLYDAVNGGGTLVLKNGIYAFALYDNVTGSGNLAMSMTTLFRYTDV